MADPIIYNLKHAHGIVDLVLTDDRFIVNTQGVGLLDKLRTIDTSLANIKQFALVPTIGAQNVIDRRAGENVYDTSHDAEFIFSYQEQGKLKKKRVLVNSHDENFQAILTRLESARADASLLSLQPAEAMKRIGAVQARTALFIIIGLLVGVPLIIAIIYLIVMTLK